MFFMKIRSSLLIAVLLMTLKVSVQSIIVEAYLRGTVILPCSTSRHEENFFWRHENTKSVYDFIEGREDVTDQDPAYRNRVKGFVSEVAKGNYSISLSDVRPSDAGTYSCLIPEASTVYVELKVKDIFNNPRTGARNGGSVIKASSIAPFLLIYILLCSLAL